MTTRQARIVAFIAWHWYAHGYAPTVREIAEAAGYSVGTVSCELAVLKRLGQVERFQRYRGWRLPK